MVELLKLILALLSECLLPRTALFYFRGILSVGPSSLVLKSFKQTINIFILSEDIQFDFETKIESRNF